jgi:hypothetical protein
MLGGSEGIETSFNAGEFQRFEFSFDMTETNMEEIDDLEVAVWVQTYDSKEVHNSNYLNEYIEHPYPVQNLQLEGLSLTWEAPAHGSPSAYMIYINGELVSDNTTSLSYTIDETVEAFSVEVIAVYDDIKSIGMTNFVSSCETPQNVAAAGNEDDMTITISWDDIEGAEEYQLYRNGTLLTTTTYTEYIDDNIESGVSYCYNVRTYCGEGNYSGFSEEACTHVGEIDPEDPEDPENPDAIDELENNLKIYPNPANDFIKLSAVGYQLSVIKIYNYLGILIGEFEANSNEIEINISNYNSGVYFIEINTENGNNIKRIIKN